MHLLGVSNFMDVPFLTKRSFLNSKNKLGLVFVLCNSFRRSLEFWFHEDVIYNLPPLNKLLGCVLVF